MKTTDTLINKLKMKNTKMYKDFLPVFIGYDSREQKSYKACENSIKRRTPNVVTVPLIQDELRQVGLYSRNKDEKASTEFSLTRFLVPWMKPRDDSGLAIFCDCDFIFQENLKIMIQNALTSDTEDDNIALWVIKWDVMECALHNMKFHQDTSKMGGFQQEYYPRKWWSALVVWNLTHPAHKNLTIEDVNKRPPSWLHRFGWLNDNEIGEIDARWGWLDGYVQPMIASGIHFTRGTPEWPGWENTFYANKWRKELENDPSVDVLKWRVVQ